MANVLGKIFGTRNSRQLKRMSKVVTDINSYADELGKLSDEELKAKTPAFKERIAAGESVDDVLPEAFAVCREASTRVMSLRHFDVQLIGGMTLHEGNIAEMRTGEGKTLVATLPAYANALSGRSVHLVTVNDYLARRDSEWMRPLYEFIGLTVGVVVPNQSREEKAAAYGSDIVYGTNNEFGFDYLRDNMAVAKEDRMQRDRAFAIIDEVDSILIDEARTPLIISGPADDHSALYKHVNKLVPILRPVIHPESERGWSISAKTVFIVEEGGAKAEQALDIEAALTLAEDSGKELVALDKGKVPECVLVDPGHFTVDEKTRQLDLTEAGHELVEELLVKEGLLTEGESLYGTTNLSLLHHILTGLRSHVMFHSNVDYMVQDGEVVLIDEHTGRTMPGRRLSEGLHQAIEAKEGVAIQTESQTLASTTFQNFFRLYDKLSGMTGTADTEAAELQMIYGLEVVVVPTNQPVNRDDLNDLIFLSKQEKMAAIVDDVRSCMEKNAPILVGAASVEASEELSELLKKHNIKHQVLNAKFHATEAEIIVQAGRPGAVTIATNMAGRGTDIVLGGNVEAEITAMDNPSDELLASLREEWKQRHQQVIDAGGLHVLGTERHESRRIDNQLRGRSGRQGDPGLSRFYLSLDDDLMRIFASERVKNFMQALGMEKGEAIEHKMVTNSIEKAQRKVEGRNFDARKALLDYDDVANDQRQIIYHQRNLILEADNYDEMLTAVRSDVINDLISDFVPKGSVYEQWDVAGLEQNLESDLNLQLPIQQWLDEDKSLNEEPLRERVLAVVQTGYEEKMSKIGPESSRFERHIMLQVLDQHWKDHLSAMDHLRHGIHLRGYAGKNPKQEYKRESYGLFEKMLDGFNREVISFLAKVQIKLEDADELEQRRREEEQNRDMDLNRGAEIADQETKVTTGFTPVKREERKVGRNEPCPCGSGKKFKQCHGKL
ncbi:MAG: preprotein translocase subunit SecA [Chitinophagales bacterium]|jgi:preprotein translocase subunit SecA